MAVRVWNMPVCCAAGADGPQEKRLRLTVRRLVVASSGCELHATPWLAARSAGVSSATDPCEACTPEKTL